jgi:hypothetical protein
MKAMIPPPPGTHETPDLVKAFAAQGLTQEVKADGDDQELEPDRGIAKGKDRYDHLACHSETFVSKTSAFQRMRAARHASITR